MKVGSVEQQIKNTKLEKKYKPLGRGGKIVVGIVMAIGGLIALMGIILRIKSPGKVAPYRNERGEIVEGTLASKELIEINGAEMGMIIKSKNINNPVLLFVHGGVGMPEYFLNHTYPSKLDELFTVVWWEQRGAGLSYDKTLKLEDITTTTAVSDIIAVSKYLKERFGQDKIYLMSHSAGSYGSILAVKEAPELYEAYIGMGQMRDQSISEVLACEYMQAYYAEKGDYKKVEKLKTYFGTKKYNRIRDAYMHDSGIGTTRKMKSVVTEIFFESFNAPEYTLKEKINIWKGKVFGSQTALQKEMRRTDLGELITQLEVPIYFFSGAYDYTVNYKMSQEFLSQIKAPIKGFYLFEDSAHSPVFEEPDLALQILKDDILNKKADLATS